DFSFLTGSCAYFNEPQYDRPGKPYGGDSSIFETMAKEKAAFMLWLGDNWYTREPDFSPWGMWYRAHRDRSMPVLQNFLKAMPQYATWDDHDYGPNDIGQSFILKETSKKIFDAYWANPSSGINGEGVYTQLSYSDVDIFVTDDRWWRSADHIQDSVNGKPNPGKVMLGARQMEWLKNALAYSQATFKIIVVGSQVLNPLSPFDKLLNFPVEYYELMHFISDNKISGILFLTGDRHHSEVIKVDRPGTYPLFDITVSSLTAGVAGFSQAEQHSPYNQLKIEKNNYGRFSFSGPKGQRRLLVEFIGTKGEKLGEWSVLETQLKAER
ncbi:MAG: alkaline phosphatase family protein, partial [Flavisolibacter sp.]|nr:alkaline phosphatase family protein [Flavisolibacter sp.]